MRNQPEWEVWPEFLHYKVARRVVRDFLGSGYVFARRAGCFVRFLTVASAQKYADKLNGQDATKCGV